MSPGSRPIDRTFSRAGKYYDQAAALQQTIALQLLSSFKTENVVSDVLEIGAGTGFLTRALSARFPHASIRAIDSAKGMLDICEAKFEPSSNVSFQLADAQSFAGEKQSVDKYDLITGSSVLQWIVQRRVLFEQLKAMLGPHGRLLFSVMLSGTLRELRALRSEMFPEKTGKNWLPSSAELNEDLARADCMVLKYHQESRTEYFESAHALIAHLSASGTTGTGYSNKALNRGELRELCSEYDARYTNANKTVPATYEIAYFEAQ